MREDKEKEKRTDVDLGVELYESAKRYKLGEGGVKKDLVEARRLYKESANKGYGWGQYEYAECLKTGLGGERDEGMAAAYYEYAAKQSIPEAQYALGECYRDGRGVDKDLWEAVKWLDKAARQQYDPALAESEYCRGMATEYLKNELKYEEAVKYYQSAAEKGHSKACEVLNRLEAAYLIGSSTSVSSSSSLARLVASAGHFSSGSASTAQSSISSSTSDPTQEFRTP